MTASKNKQISVTLPRPEDSDCYLLLNPPVDPAEQRLIKLRYFIETSFVNSSAGNQVIESKDIEINPNTTTFPFTTSIKGASTRDFRIIVTVHGEECSTCSRTHGGGPTGPGQDGACGLPEQEIVGGIVVSEKGARSRWENSKTASAGSSIAFDKITRIPNIPNSCGCRVNNDL